MVLDVAGGTGALSFELENLNGIGCCVLDPRPLRLGRLRLCFRHPIRSIVALRTESGATS